MAEFRFYCLNNQDRIIVGDTWTELDLEVAIQAAYRACRDHAHSSSRIEVWKGTSRLYSSRDQRTPDK